MYLRVTATYEDGNCAPCNTKKTAQVISENAVLAKLYVNVLPKFLDEDDEDLDSTDRSVAENSAVGSAVGDPVAATDPGRDGPDVLTYSIGGTDGSSFDIDSGTGQIKVKAALDFETIRPATQ